MDRTYRVEGMTCQGCVKALTRALNAAAPQATVEVDLASGQVTVDGLDDAATVAQAVTDAGFEFIGAV